MGAEATAAGTGAATGAGIGSAAGPVGAGIGAVVGGIAGYLSAEDTNEANVELAKKQMEYQTYMSNTAHQREVADLKAAGLNPILSATGGSGASTPSGAMGHVDNVFTQASQSAKTMADVGSTLSTLQPQVLNTLADTSTKLQNAKLLAMQTDSTAKDVEAKEIQNASSATILGQQIKKSDLDIDFLKDTYGNRLYKTDSEATKAGSDAYKAGIDANLSEKSFAATLSKLQSEALRSKLGVDSDALGVDAQKQSLKYDYLEEKMFDSLGLTGSSAKDGATWRDRAGALGGLALKYGDKLLHVLPSTRGKRK